ncbi:SusC/RagA family TonB-linked outer membrane protein [Chitinophaga filiformis]|uniref:TonB-linked outer membrane protein, SusC/RagA family n=1 Tax=Chitinophaga filiformis TaxID=104663 RepID=A0A1G7HWM8_CHIFI|nr:SusC/RagA family TonB-linked outer membrane protein [Chitinophaga filiformis]SDF04584.1 TonB-linked outer membrane protein, SusC/RagA family [Chitinophaga filiformis]
MQKNVKLNRALLYCCMVVLFSLYFKSYAAAPTQGKPVSLTIKNSSLAEVLRQVSKKSGLYIYFQDADLEAHKNVTIDVRNKPVESVLHELLDGRGFSWVEVGENTIAVKKKPDPELERRIEGDSVSTITVTGKVVDEKGEPVIGASIAVKGSKNGTITSADGAFLLKGVKDNSSLIISNISFLTQEIAVKGRTSIGSIQLKEYVGVLDEAVVIAYGQTTKRFATGSVGVLRTADIEKQPVSNPLYALQGRIPGLIVTPTSGLPGAPVTVQIRGRSSLNAGSEPLFIIDGVPYNNSMSALVVGVGALGLGMSPLNFINPSDIESISVLKDADATAIYGSRGANGVILITTKKGKYGVTKVDINIQQGISQVAKRIKTMNTEQYLAMRKEALKNDGLIDRLNDPSFSEIYPDLMLWDQSRYTDWQKVLIGNNASYTNAQSSITGGTEVMQYLIGGNYHRETTVFPGENANSRGGGHFSITGNSNDKKFSATLTGSYLASKSSIPPTDFTNQAITNEPNAPAGYNPDGTVNWALFPATGIYTTWQTPPYSATLLNPYELKINNLTTSTEIKYQFRPVMLKVNAGYNEIRGNSFKGTTIQSFQPAYASFNFLRNAAYSDNIIRNISVEPQISYAGDIFKGKADILIGGSFQSNTAMTNDLILFDFPSDLLLKSKSAASSVQYKNNTTSQYKYCAVFARIGYNLNGKYLLNINARRDGSSRFGPGNQFGNFGSIGAAWVFSDEEFIKINKSILSFGKLRLSYGTAGNDGIGNYQYLEQYQNILANPYQGAMGYQTTGLFNPYYHWETSRKLEMALEIGTLKDRILLTANYYRHRSDNQLISYPYPSMAGYGSLIKNLPALTQNSGIEIILATTNIKNKNFSWSANLNVTVNRNKLLKYPNLQNSAFAQSIVGQPFWGFVDVFKSAGVDPISGLYQFQSQKGEVVSNPNTSDFPKYGKDIRIVTAPKFYGGLLNSFTFKNLSLDVFIEFKKQMGVNPLYQVEVFPGASRMNQPAEIFGKQWKKEGDVAMYQKFTTTSAEGAYDRYSYYANSDKGFVDATFIRFKNISLSYTLNENIRRSLHVKNLRIYVQGQNLWTITKYDGLDPETQSLSFLPPLRTITAGLQLGL